jgi:hypothetical protein
VKTVIADVSTAASSCVLPPPPSPPLTAMLRPHHPQVTSFCPVYFLFGGRSSRRRTRATVIFIKDFANSVHGFFLFENFLLF